MRAGGWPRLKSSGFVPALRLQEGRYAILPWEAVQKMNTYGVPTHMTQAYCPSVARDLRPVSFLLTDENRDISSAWTRRPGVNPARDSTPTAARPDAKPSGPS